MPWTVPALAALRVSLHDITVNLPKSVDSTVVCESGNDKQNDGASCVTDFSRSAEFSRNFGLKVICLFCY